MPPATRSPLARVAPLARLPRRALARPSTRPLRRALALALAGLLALPTSAHAHARVDPPTTSLLAPGRDDAPPPSPRALGRRSSEPSAAAPADRAPTDVPLAVPGAEPTPEPPAQPAPSDTSDPPGPSDHGRSATPEGPAPPPPRDLTPAPDKPDAALHVAVGLGPSAPGTASERALVDALERAARASIRPTTTVRRLRPGVGEGKQVCRERRDDLVILVEYLPDRPDPVLFAHDCRLDRALAVRGSDAADHPELVAALWAEHDELVRQGAQERRRGRLGPKVRTGLVVGGAILAIGVAVGFVVAASLRREVVVLTVSP